MKSRPPTPEMSLPISLEMYHQLLTVAASTGFEKEYWEVGATALRDWLGRNAPESFGMPVTAGYQWKHLFLPDGTVLRTIFEGKNYHCVVEKDQILFNGVKTSPSGFANAVGGVRRNAWKVVWLLFPNTTVWQLAGTLRTSKRQDKSQRNLYR